MKSGIYILCLTLFITSCGPHAYDISGGQHYQFELDYKLLQDSTFIEKSIKNSTKYIPIYNTSINQSHLLYNAFLMLNKTQRKKLKNYLEEQKDTTSCDYKLALMYYYVAKHEFQNANNLYSNLCKVSIRFSEELIYADLQFELALYQGNLNYNQQLALYQDLIDKHIHDELAKTIIKSRARRLRYINRNF